MRLWMDRLKPGQKRALTALALPLNGGVHRAHCGRLTGLKQVYVVSPTENKRAYWQEKGAMVHACEEEVSSKIDRWGLPSPRGEVKNRNAAACGLQDTCNSSSETETDSYKSENSSLDMPPRESQTLPMTTTKKQSATPEKARKPLKKLKHFDIIERNSQFRSSRSPESEATFTPHDRSGKQSSKQRDFSTSIDEQRALNIGSSRVAGSQRRNLRKPAQILMTPEQMADKLRAHLTPIASLRKLRCPPRKPILTNPQGAVVDITTLTPLHQKCIEAQRAAAAEGQER